MENPKVQCNVDTCVYNEGAKVCHATAIQITRHHAQVHNPEGTDCGTFEVR